MPFLKPKPKQPEPESKHKASFSHELVAGAASYDASSAFKGSKQK